MGEEKSPIQIPVEYGRGSATSVDLFSYTLPEELIAKHPTERRDGSRLMVCPRNGGAVEHRLFHQITDYFRAGDLPVGLYLHVDEVDDDDASDVPEAQLIDDLTDGFKVSLQDSIL